MMEKQNAVERKKAAGDAAEIDDVIDAGAEQFAKAGAAVSKAGVAAHSTAGGRPRTENMC